MCDCAGLPSSDLVASVRETPQSVNAVGPGYEVKGYEKLAYSYSFVDDIFDVAKDDLSSYFQKWKRCLAIMDETVYGHYGQKTKAYFAAHGIDVTIHVFKGGELNKTMTTMLDFVDAMDRYGLIRKEPVLVVGGGLASDVVGYACASYRRSSNFIRVSTTLIGLIDAAVSIKVGLNHGKLKNRLGAYHAPMHTFLDFDFLKTLPVEQVRNGFAEIVKISHVAHKPTWDRLVKYGPELVETRFGRTSTGDRAVELRQVASVICRDAIKVMLDLESPNLHEIGLDRVIASGHTWSPTLELTPTVPLRHGHAIMIDMSFSITLAHSRGYITERERDEFFDLQSQVGLSMDHEDFDAKLLLKATDAILKTRDGKQRFAVPKPLGTCFFINDASDEELTSALATHKAHIRERYPHMVNGVGKSAFVDAGDLGHDPAELVKKAMNGKSKPLNASDSMRSKIKAIDNVSHAQSVVVA
ncbi:hypothetical protein BDV98DRAFT_556828 [Pterulicium gracile]|uniref:Uncharacterized protein n=1 Tax=Pterulicium gracile TaxID=1884261 RepID=A0A5C3QXZ9_9AGAR|nr:hypothetical protein BDV98DRAFT_556828 [Pterula gracilis]